MSYKKQLKSFNLNTIAITSLLMFVLPFVVFAAVNLALKRPLLLTGKVYWDIIMTFAMLAALLCIHEFLHALGAIMTGGATFKDIKFGIHLKQMMLYCHIGKPLKAGAYKFAIILPLIVTGIIPLVISAIWGNIFLVVLFCFMVSGGAGDVIMFISLAGAGKDTLVLDHPSAPAYYLMYEEGKEPKDFVESTPEQEEALVSAMQKPTFNGKNTIKILLIALFCALVVLGLYLAALAMKIF